MRLKNTGIIMLLTIIMMTLIACGGGDKENAEIEAESNNVENEEQVSNKDFELDNKTVEKVDAPDEKSKKNKDDKIVAEKNDKEELKEKDTVSKDDDSKDKETKKTEPEKKQPEKKSVQVTAASGTYYVTSDSLNVRTGDGTEYKQLGSIKKHTKIEVTGKTSENWYEFKYDNKKAYVSGNFLTDKKPQKNKPKKESNTNTSKQNKSESANTSKPNKSESTNKSKDLVVDGVKLNTIGNSKQVILVTTKGSSTSTGKVWTYEKDGSGSWKEILNVTAYIGKNGFASNKKEGDGKSPIGKYTIGHAFGYQGNPGTKLSFKSSTSDDVWVDDSNSKFYNTWQKESNHNKDWNSAESMMHRLYNYGFTINYNTGQTPGKGSAICMHVGNSYTVGCTAMSQGNLLSIMKWVDPGKNPVIIQTPESGLANY